jgi:hypothetical protein
MALHRKICCISISVFLLISGCNPLDHNEKQYFKESKEGLEELLSLISNKYNLSLIVRRSYIGPIYKLLKLQEINYKLENYERELEISFELNKYFEDESSEIRKLISNNDVKSIFNYENKLITLDSALKYFQLSKEELISIFDKMKELEVTFIQRFNEDNSSIAFRIDDRFYLIYTRNISNLILEIKKSPEELDDNWYYYVGVL